MFFFRSPFRFPQTNKAAKPRLGFRQNRLNFTVLCLASGISLDTRACGTKVVKCRTKSTQSLFLLDYRRDLARVVANVLPFAARGDKNDQRTNCQAVR